ncbi:MAG: cytidine deaminase [Bacteroidia bacterium]|nr:cytidine deaminase [Bacteroidia bacterium]
MKVENIRIQYDTYVSQDELESSDLELLNAARANLKKSYSPYSNFKVACAIRLGNGKIITGTNQENASFPVGLCAERVALSAVDAMHRGVKIIEMAITASSERHEIDHPIAPCGNCRQAISEAQLKSGNAIKIILQGESGQVFIFKSIDQLLPFSFNHEYLQ